MDERSTLNYFINAAPQTGIFNSGAWSNVESYVKDKIKFGVVVTGVCMGTKGYIDSTYGRIYVPK